MTGGDGALRTISGTFFPILFEPSEATPLRGAVSPRGRYHHDEQPALYISPRPEWARMAVAPYVRPDDPPRTMWRLSVDSARVADVRDAALWRALGIDPDDSAVPLATAIGRGYLPRDLDRFGRCAAGWCRWPDLYGTQRCSPLASGAFRWNELGGPVVRVAD